MENKKDFTFTVKDVIYIVALVLSVTGSYFAQASKVSMLEKQVTENTRILQDNNLELINYKLDALISNVDKLVAKLEE